MGKYEDKIEQRRQVMSLINSGIIENIKLALELNQSLDLGIVFYNLYYYLFNLLGINVNNVGIVHAIKQITNEYYVEIRAKNIKPEFIKNTLSKIHLFPNLEDIFIDSIDTTNIPVLSETSTLKHVEFWNTNIKKQTFKFLSKIKLASLCFSYGRGYNTEYFSDFLNSSVASNIQELRTYKCNIGELQSSWFLNFNNIKWLRLRNSNLTYLANSLFTCYNLKILNLCKNSLTKLSENIGELKQLTEINLSDNYITNIPNSICELKYLRKLKLASNNLQALPKEIGKLKNLEVLNIENNPIYKLPEEIGQLTNLKILYLKGTNITKKIRNTLTSQLPNTKIYF